MGRIKSVKPYKDRDREMIRERWATLGLSEKCRYIWFYYRAYIIICLILAAFAVFFIRDIREKKPDEAFYVMVLDHALDEAKVEEMTLELAKCLGIDLSRTACVIETAYSGGNNMESAATVSAYMQAGRVDLLIAPEDKFNTYAATGFLDPLTLQMYEGLTEGMDGERLFYASPVDYSQGGAVREIPFRPHEQKGDACCYGIYLTDGVFEGMVAGVMANGSHKERVMAGMGYFLQ